MGERQVLVDPGAARQARRVQLARRQHDLPVLPVDHVAVVVDGGEVVIRADFLDLPERVEQRPVVPERHVDDRCRVAIEVGARQVRVSCQRPLGHAVEAIRRARRLDVVLNELGLTHLFVRRDDEALDAGGIGAPSGRDDDVEAGRGGDRPQPAGRERLPQRQCGAQHGGDDEDPRGGDARVDIGVGGASHVASRASQQLRDLQPRAEAEDEEEQRRQHGEVPRRAPRHEQPARRLEPDFLAEHVRRLSSRPSRPASAPAAACGRLRAAAA